MQRRVKTWLDMVARYVREFCVTQATIRAVTLSD